MIEIIFSLVAVIGLAKVIYDDATDRIWRELGKSYPATWRKNPWGTISTMRAWDDSSRRKRWYNGVHISFEASGLRLDPTFISKWYKGSILVPWKELQRQPDETERGRLVMQLKTSPTWISIDKKYYDESRISLPI